MFISLLDLDTWVYLEVRELDRRARVGLEARRLQKLKRHPNTVIVTNIENPEDKAPNRAERRANQRLSARLMKKLTRRGKR